MADCLTTIRRPNGYRRRSVRCFVSIASPHPFSLIFLVEKPSLGAGHLVQGTRLHTKRLPLAIAPAARTKQAIGWALHAVTTAVEHMGVDHGGLHIAMAQKFLHGADVIACLQQLRGKAMPQRVRAGWLRNAGTAPRLTN